MLAFAPLLLALAPAPGQVGFYRSNQMEISAALELSANGRFRYQLDYGAVSESGEGDWTSDGRYVLLTSNPMPKAPAYVLVEDEPLPRGKLGLRVVAPQSPYFDQVDVLVSIDGGAARELRIAKNETIALPPGKVATVTVLVPMYGQAAGRFRLPLSRGHRLSLRFEPNQATVARFERTPLAIDHGALLLRRYDTLIRFERAQP